MSIDGDEMSSRELTMRICEIFLATGVLLVALFVVPFVVVLYCIPSIRASFEQLAYEDAMRG